MMAPRVTECSRFALHFRAQATAAAFVTPTSMTFTPDSCMASITGTVSFRVGNPPVTYAMKAGLVSSNAWRSRMLPNGVLMVWSPLRNQRDIVLAEFLAWDHSL